MEFALSQEESGIKLFIRGIKWMEIVNALKDESVKVDCFDIMINNLFVLKDGGDNDPYLELSLSEIICPLAKIKEKVVLLNPLENTRNVDEVMLKESKYPWLVTEGLSGHEIWEKYVEYCLIHEEPIEVKLGNEDIYVESYAPLMQEGVSYCITFQGKEKIVNFLNQPSLNIASRSREDLINAAQEGKPFATEGLRAEFAEAGNINRMLNLEILKGREWNDSPEQKLSKEFALSLENTSLKLFAQGISWKDFLQVFEDEVVDVFELNVIGPDKFPSNNDYFEVVEDNSEELTGSWLKFRRKQLSFRELFTRVSSLNVNDDLKEPFLADIGNRNFEMNFTFADSCCRLTFWQKDRLLHFLERMGDIIPQTVMTELKNALNEGKSYCTEGLRQDFERASNQGRIERLIELIEYRWVPGEEEELKRALAFVTNGLPSQPGSEFSESDGVRTYPSGELLVFFRLLRDGMDCFDGEGNIYGFKGEMVIRNVITFYEENMSKEYRNINVKTYETNRSKEYIDIMRPLLEKYIAKFRFSA